VFSGWLEIVFNDMAMDGEYTVKVERFLVVWEERRRYFIWFASEEIIRVGI
jgi:hypothetical protein